VNNGSKNAKKNEGMVGRKWYSWGLKRRNAWENCLKELFHFIASL
jgi:hypothetical protein